jgi:Uma2 family endonuclease
VSKLEKPRFSAAQYLSMERASNEKREFAFGEMFSSTRASARHVEIVINNNACQLTNQFRQRAARVYSMNLRLCVDKDCRFTYPDVIVVCGQPKFLDETLDTLLNPELIVEVLSESTRNYDRGDKFQQYRGIPSFREYLLVDQESVHVERYSKGNDGIWSLWETDMIGDVVRLDSVGVALAVSEIYFKSRPAHRGICGPPTPALL